MDIFQVQDLFKLMNPGKNISFEFDINCRRIVELVFTDGLPNPVHHIENNKVKVTVEGNAPVYVPIMPHREIISWENIRQSCIDIGLTTWIAPENPL